MLGPYNLQINLISLASNTKNEFILISNKCNYHLFQSIFKMGYFKEKIETLLCKLASSPGMIRSRLLNILKEENCDMENLPVFFTILLEITEQLLSKVQELQKQSEDDMFLTNSGNMIEVKNIEKQGKQFASYETISMSMGESVLNYFSTQFSGEKRSFLYRYLCASRLLLLHGKKKT